MSSVDFYFNSLNIFRYHLGHSTSSSTVELVYSVRILSFAGGNGLRDHGRAGISSFNGLERIVVFEVHDVDSFKLLCGLFQLLHMTVSWSSSSWCIRAHSGVLLSDAFVRIPTYVALSWREKMSVPATTEQVGIILPFTYSPCQRKCSVPQNKHLAKMQAQLP